MTSMLNSFNTHRRPVASPAQCRAARALLRWTQDRLADRAAVARKTVADFELGNRSLHRRTRLDMTIALEAAGIEFMWGTEGDGVRFARTAPVESATTSAGAGATNGSYALP
jgi:transcriptional regulator with XRE-family HTH domain